MTSLALDSLAVLPYDRRLHRFPAYLQQLEMESNGKSVTRDGAPVGYATGTSVWGEPGNNAQHSFFQLLHQGTAHVALDFIAPVNGSSRFAAAAGPRARELLRARPRRSRSASPREQVRADLQAKGAACARASSAWRRTRCMPATAPSSLILFPRLDPRALGQLIAWYEHKVFVQSVIWDINPFDQWGVELGKKLATFDDASRSVAGAMAEWPAAHAEPARAGAALARGLTGQ